MPPWRRPRIFYISQILTHLGPQHTLRSMLIHSLKRSVPFSVSAFLIFIITIPHIVTAEDAHPSDSLSAIISGKLSEISENLRDASRALHDASSEAYDQTTLLNELPEQPQDELSPKQACNKPGAPPDCSAGWIGLASGGKQEDGIAEIAHKAIRDSLKSLEEVARSQRMVADSLMNSGRELEDKTDLIHGELSQLSKNFQSRVGTEASVQKCVALQPKDLLYAGTFIIGLLGFLVTTFRQLHYKRVDTMLEFQKRFHELVDYKSDLEPPPSQNSDDQNEPQNNEGQQATQIKTTEDPAIKRHNWLHWSLQHQQFSIWRKGLLSHSTYHFWMSRRVLDESLPERNFELKQWESMSQYFVATDYHKFMTELFAVKLTVNSEARRHARDVMWANMNPLGKFRFLFNVRWYPEGIVFLLMKTIRGRIGAAVGVVVIALGIFLIAHAVLTC